MASVLGRSPEGEAPLAWPSLQGHRLGDRGRAPCSQSQASCLQSGDMTVTNCDGPGEQRLAALHVQRPGDCEGPGPAHA